MNKKVEIVFPEISGVDRVKLPPEVQALWDSLEKSLQERLEKSGCLDDLDDPPTTGKKPTRLEQHDNIQSGSLEEPIINWQRLYRD